MTPQELISTLKQLHEAATPEPWHEIGIVEYVPMSRSANRRLAASLRNNLPRIIRLLEAGEMANSALEYMYSEFKNQETILANDPIKEAAAALSAYEEAGK